MGQATAPAHKEGVAVSKERRSKDTGGEGGGRYKYGSPPSLGLILHSVDTRPNLLLITEVPAL